MEHCEYANIDAEKKSNAHKEENKKKRPTQNGSNNS